MSNITSTDVRQSYTIDQAAPTASLASKPPLLSTSTNASFAFTANDPIAGGVSSGIHHLEYQLDGGNITVASSPLSFSGLSLGNHTFTLRAVDNAGNFSPATNYNWTIGTFPSVTSILRQSPNGTSTNASSVTFQVAFSEAVSGVDASDFSLSSSGSIITESPQVSAVNGSIYNVTVNGIVGNGTLGLGVINDGTIQDLAGLPLANGTNSNWDFQPPATYVVVAQPSLVLVADLNGDGILDLATGSYSSSRGTVLLGNGNGTFQPQKTFATTGTGSTSIGVGDFNGDGKKDLVLTLEIGGRINLLAGDGNGNFLLQSTAATGTHPKELEVADFNKDGKLDVAIASRTGGFMGVLLGNGNGTFQPIKTYASGSGSLMIETADMNGDGNLDLAVTNLSSNTVSLYLGFGNGTFQAQKTLAVGTTPGDVTLVDLNGDGAKDIVVPNKSNNTISVLLGNGNGTFQPQATYPAFNTPYYTTVGDMNGDGNLDVVVQSILGATLSILAGNGDGTFQLPRTYSAGTINGGSGLAIADLNADGSLDMVYVDYPGAGLGAAGVLLANGTFVNQSYAIDQAAPTVSLTSQPPLQSASTNASFAFTGNDPVVGGVSSGIHHLEYQLDGGNITVGSSPVSLSGLSLGNHTFTLRAVDNVGNLGPVTSYNWSIGTYPSATSILRQSPNGTSTNASSVTFQVAFSEAVTGVDASDFTLSSSGKRLHRVASGQRGERFDLQRDREWHRRQRHLGPRLDE